MAALDVFNTAEGKYSEFKAAKSKESVTKNFSVSFSEELGVPIMDTVVLNDPEIPLD